MANIQYDDAEDFIVFPRITTKKPAQPGDRPVLHLRPPMKWYRRAEPARAELDYATHAHDQPGGDYDSSQYRQQGGFGFDPPAMGWADAAQSDRTIGSSGSQTSVPRPRYSPPPGWPPHVDYLPQATYRPTPSDYSPPATYRPTPSDYSPPATYRPTPSGYSSPADHHRTYRSMPSGRSGSTASGAGGDSRSRASPGETDYDSGFP